MEVAPPPRRAKGSCISRLQSIQSKGSDGSSRVSRYILDDPERASGLTIYELAAGVGISVATVSRFCNTLGYENFRAFQLDLNASLHGNYSAISDNFEPHDKPETIIHRVFEINRRSLVDTEKMLQDKDIISIAKLLISAGRVFLVGIGGSGLIAKSAALRFESLGITPFAIVDPYEALFTLFNAGKDDVVIGITHTGRSEPVLKLMRFAKDRGAHTVGMTNYSDSVLAEMCEHTLLTSLRERRVSAGVSSSRIAQMCLLDALYFVVAYYLGEEAEGRATEIEMAAESLFRGK